MNAPIDPTHEITLHIPDAVAQKLAEYFDGTLEDAALLGLKLFHGMGGPTYAALGELATKLNVSVTKVLRLAIADMQARHPSGPTPRGRPPVNKARDGAIYHAIRTGSTYAQVSRQFGLSIVRVGQIVAQQRAALGLERPAPGHTHRHATTPGPTPPATSTSTFTSTPADTLTHAFASLAKLPHELPPEIPGLPTTPTPEPTPEPAARPAPEPLTASAKMMRDVAEGMLVKDAALLRGIDEALAMRAHAAYLAALEGVDNPSRAERAAASYAGLYVLDNPEAEVLSLKETPRRQLAMPGLATRAPHEIPDTRTPAERDTVDPDFGF